MKERMRNRFKIYPAPKATITLKVFKEAVASRKQAEALAEDAETCPENDQRDAFGSANGTFEGHTAEANGLNDRGAHDLDAEQQVTCAYYLDQTSCQYHIDTKDAWGGADLHVTQ